MKKKMSEEIKQVD